MPQILEVADEGVKRKKKKLVLTIWIRTGFSTTNTFDDLFVCGRAKEGGMGKVAPKRTRPKVAVVFFFSEDSS